MRNIAWFENLHPMTSDEECMEAFSDIENMTVERFYNNYIKSKGDAQHRIVELGLWSIDIKERLKFLTDEPDNAEMHRIVIRG